jgi:type VI secretion system protein ImpA
MPINKKYQKFLDPISSEQPCGIDVDGTEDLIKLDLLVRGKEETQFSQAVPPDWDKVVLECEKLLTKSKSINVISYLVIGLFQTEGIYGLRIGIELLVELIEKYWGSIYPLIEPKDEEQYSYRKNQLDLLFSVKEKLYSMLNLSVISDSQTFKKLSIRGIIDLLNKNDQNKDSSEKNIIIHLESINEILDNIHKMNNIFQEYTNGEMKINVEAFTKGLQIASSFLEVELSKQIGNDERELDEENHSYNISEKNKMSVENREDVRLCLEAVCQWYEHNELSSPVPLFIKRALLTFDMNFADIILNLANDGYSQIINLFSDALIKTAVTEEQNVTDRNDFEQNNDSSYNNISNIGYSQKKDLNNDFTNSVQGEQNINLSEDPR